MEARAFCPGHISTFFVPQGGAATPPERRGSLGSGFCIAAGVHTTVAARRGASRRLELHVSDNGKRAQATGITRSVLERLLDEAGAAPASLRISNRHRLPLGAGFGVSGAIALATALAANEAMALALPRAACVEAAHRAEVLHLTGLGDVAAQSVGGFELRLRAGPPPRGRLATPGAPRASVALASFGPRPTSAFLQNPAGKARLAREGRACLRALRRAPTIAESARLGRRFAEELGLVSPRAAAFFAGLPPSAPASVAMLGDSVFALGGPALQAAARRAARGAFFMTTRLEGRGARLL